MRLRHVKYIKQQLSHYWVEAKAEVIVAAPVTSPTELITFFLKDRSGLFVGPTFEPEHGEKDHLGWTTRQRTSGELLESLGNEKDDYRAALAVVYDKVLFMYFSSTSGLVSLYLLEQTKVVKLPFVLETAPGISDLRCIDNLLIVGSLSRQSSALFDLHSSEPNESLCLTDHCQSPVSPEFSQKLDNSSRDLLEMFVSVASVNSFFQLTPSQLSVDHDVLIDAKEGAAYMLGVRQEAIARGITERIDAVDFLMRRKHCGELAARYIYEEMQHTTLLTAVSSLLVIYVSHFSDGDSQGLQGDILRCMFQPAWGRALTVPDMDYLIAISLEYQRLVNEQDMDTWVEFQILLLEQLIAHSRFDTLLSLLHRCVFSTSLPIAILLVEAKNSNIRSFGLDMLWRLSETETLIQVLWRQELTFEAQVVAEGASFLYLPQTDVSMPS